MGTAAGINGRATEEMSDRLLPVGGMATTLFLTRYLMPVLYSFYGHREPPAGSANLAH